MENAVWLFVVAGGAAALGLVLATGMLKQDPKRSRFAIFGAMSVAVIALAFALFVANMSSTAPSNPPDPSGNHYDGPARPSDENALPGTPTPTDNR
jgi:multisubunit Na+/H+ antiporter MnhB subunit